MIALIKHLFLVVWLCLLFVLLLLPKNTQAATDQTVKLIDFHSFTHHGDHLFEVNLPEQGFGDKELTLNVVLGCAQQGCSDWDYTIRFEWHADSGEVVELGRLITPYAGYMQRGMKGFDRQWRRLYQFDVTHFMPLLRGRGQFVVHYGGWGAKKSAFGVAATIDVSSVKSRRAVKRVLPLYYSSSEGWPYKNAESFADFLPASAFSLKDDEAYAEVKMIVSGHGHALSFDNAAGKPELCGEWCDRYFELLQDNQIITRQQLWRQDCDQSPTYPQGGTYLFSRANWCPGEIVTPFSFPVSTENETFVLDVNWQSFSWEPSPYGKTAPRYIVSAVLVTYEDVAVSTDVAIEKIISPNRDLAARDNASCGTVEVEIKNRGETDIYLIDFDYGIQTGLRYQHQWQGHLAPGELTRVVLPGQNWGVFDVENQPISVSLQVYGDKTQANNIASAYFNPVVEVSSAVQLALKTGVNPDETHVQVRDNKGLIVREFADFNASQLHQLSFDLPRGCYQMTVFDSAKDGLAFPFFDSRKGKGRIALVDNADTLELEPDFGRQISVPFTVDFPLGGCQQELWQADRAYNTPGEYIVYKGVIYQSKYWSYNFKPDQAGPWDPWRPISYCDGTQLN